MKEHREIEGVNGKNMVMMVGLSREHREVEGAYGKHMVTLKERGLERWKYKLEEIKLEIAFGSEWRGSTARR